MGHSDTVILDACVLYPAPLRDFLMHLALAELFRARWTNAIHDEWMGNLLKQRPDTNDRHVLAAAIQGGANIILTFNLKDFPTEYLQPHNITAKHPDDFIHNLLHLYPARICEAAANHRRSLRNPPKTVDDYLDTMLNQGITQTVAILREMKSAI
jgi:hypothetical protein